MSQVAKKRAPRSARIKVNSGPHPAQGSKFCNLRHLAYENANSAPTSKCSKSIGDSSKKLDLQPFSKINVSVGDDTPSARTICLQWSAPWRCKVEPSLGDCSGPRGSRPVPVYTPRSCQARACNLSSSSLEGVKLDQLEPGTCQVRAWNLSRSRLGPVTLEPGTCQVGA